MKIISLSHSHVYIRFFSLQGLVLLEELERRLSAPDCAFAELGHVKGMLSLNLGLSAHFSGELMKTK